MENLNFLAGTVNLVYRNGHFGVTKPSLFRRGIQLKLRFFVNYFVKYRSILPFNSKKRPDRNPIIGCFFEKKNAIIVFFEVDLP